MLGDVRLRRFEALRDVADGLFALHPRIHGRSRRFGTCTGWHIHLDLLEALLRGQPLTYKAGHDDALEAEYRARG